MALQQPRSCCWRKYGSKSFSLERQNLIEAADPRHFLSLSRDTEILLLL